jgi:hypothetical protein
VICSSVARGRRVGVVAVGSPVAVIVVVSRRIRGFGWTIA